MAAYYNEIDPYVAEWLRNLIAVGHIADGVVDERSIEDVEPSDLAGFTQCHFFAGVGVWSHALRRAGWPDDRPVWTGSCPCQPFSAAGKGAGVTDERHLWPAWQRLIAERRPPVVFGEQVEAAIKHGWLDLVQADLEGIGYAFAAAGIPAAGVGAPHIRQRLWFVADSDTHRFVEGASPGLQYAEHHAESRGELGGMDHHHHHQGLEGLGRGHQAEGGRLDVLRPVAEAGEPGGLADNLVQQRQDGQLGVCNVTDASGRIEGAAAPSGLCGDMRPGPTNGHWRDADWLFCRDGKWRPVEPGYEQMADGSASSLGRVCASDVEKIEGEINAWSIRHQADAGEALRGVWGELSAEALCEREAGRFSGVRSASVLLAFMRQLTVQGWRFADALACSRASASEIVVRVMRFDAEAARTPLRRELAEQRIEQPANPLRELSSLLAYHTEKCWGDACRAKVGAASFPSAHGAAARVGRLRAYGNCIVAPLAEEFISAYLEITPAPQRPCGKFRNP